jgi:stage V sporulation protein K
MSTTSIEAQSALIDQLRRLKDAAASVGASATSGGFRIQSGPLSIIVTDPSGGQLQIEGDLTGDATQLKGMIGSFAVDPAGWRIPDGVAHAWTSNLAALTEIAAGDEPAPPVSASPAAQTPPPASDADAATEAIPTLEALKSAATALSAIGALRVPSAANHIAPPENDDDAMSALFDSIKGALVDLDMIGGLLSPEAIAAQATRMDTNFDPSVVQAAQAATAAAQQTERGAEVAAATEAAKPVREKSTTGLLTADQQKLLDEALAELDDLVGLDDIKEQINRQVATLKMRLLRERQGLGNAETTQHMLFMGNPGTGKTTVARIMGKIFFALGVLDKGHVIETNREGLVAEYQGQTAGKTTKAVEQALGGILFVDEAYALTPEGATDTYGQEALSTLLQHMENRRGEFIVIMAGYTDDMLRMISTNFGLTSRFPNQIMFKDFTAQQLADVFRRMSGGSDYTAADDVRAQVLQIATLMIACADKTFGNARDMRNLFDRTIEEHAQRIVALDDAKDGDVAKDILETLTSEDIATSDRALTGYSKREAMRKLMAGEPVAGLEAPEDAADPEPAKLEHEAATNAFFADAKDQAQRLPEAGASGVDFTDVRAGMEEIQDQA